MKNKIYNFQKYIQLEIYILRIFYNFNKSLKLKIFKSIFSFPSFISTLIFLRQIWIYIKFGSPKSRTRLLINMEL